MKTNEPMLTTDTETVHYQSVADWLALPLAALDDAYSLMPTQRQHYYRSVLEREAGKAHAVTDAEELQVAQALLARFEADSLVPVGARWAKPPERVKAAAMAGEPLIAPEAAYDASGQKRPNLLWIGGAGVGLFLCLIIVIVMATRGGDEETSTVNPFASPTLRHTVTPTPIALEEQDTIIKDGEREHGQTYPVGLHIYPPGERQPRVLVVQRRKIDYSEWEYDPNPDTASYLLGMAVRRVVGIPFSEENADLFARLNEGAIFHLILNTGAVIEYQFERKTAVRRSDTAAFRQIAPGLILVLMGELDEDGIPTATRMLVMARYHPEQELTRGSVLSTEIDLEFAASPLPPSLIPTATPLPARDLLYVELVSAAVSPDGYLVTVLRLYNGQAETVTLYPDDIQIAFGHSPNPPGPWQPAGFAELTILPGQALDLSITWAWAGEPFVLLRVVGYRFGITPANTPTP